MIGQTVFLALLFTGMPASAEVREAQNGQQPIAVLRERGPPDTETISTHVICQGRTFSVTIRNQRAGPPLLIEARLDGRPPRDPGATAAMQAFLAEAREVHFEGTMCQSEHEIDVSLAGLRRAPRNGERDDLRRQFIIRFR